MRTILSLVLLYFFFGIKSFNAQNQTSHKMTISVEGSTTFDLESLYGGGLKIDRKINNNFSVGIFSSVYVQYLDGWYSSSGDVSVISDDGKRVVYEFNRDFPDSLNIGGGYFDTGDFSEEEVINLQIGLQIKYSLFSNRATKPYLGFNLSYNNQLPISKSKSVSVNRLPENNGILTSLEIGFDHQISNRFAFFMNVRANILTSLNYNELKLNITSLERTPDRVIDNGSGSTYVMEGFGIDRATFEESMNQKTYPSFFGNAGISYKIY